MTLAIRYAPIFLLLLMWEISSRLALISPDVLPALNDVLRQWWNLAMRGNLPEHTAASLWRAVAGLSLSILVGMSLGILLAVSRLIERLIQPTITFLYPLPKSALIPVIMIWLGFGHSAQIMVIFLGCLLPVVLSSYNGARGVDHTLVWSARSLGAKNHEILLQIVIPAALPDILSGIRIALALSFVLLVSSEMVGAREGMGFLIAFLGDSGAYAGMFAAVFTLIAVGFLADRLYLILTQYLLRWQET